LQWLRTRAGRAARRAGRRAPRLLFAFDGGAGASPQMGQQLYAAHAAFRESIEASAAIVESILYWPCAATFRTPAQLGPTETRQRQRRNDLVRLGVLQIAQVDLWRDAGIVPDAVCGMSLGEMVMPYAAGILSRDDTARVLAVMAEAISQTPIPGLKFVLNCDADTAQRLCRGAPAPLQFLGVIGPSTSVTLATAGDVEVLRSYLEGHIAREMASDWNYHTPALPVNRAWLPQLSCLRLHTPCIPVFSSVLGRQLPPGVPMDADYFLALVTQPFQFARAAGAAVAAGFEVVVAVGAEASVSNHVAEIARSQGRAVRVLQPLHGGTECEAWDQAMQEISAAVLQRDRAGTLQP
jgi:acyl transferase domain-containing protein